MVPELLEQVTFDGTIVALPVDVHREDGIFYNKHIFQNNNLKPPTSLSEFIELCNTLSSLGITPLALEAPDNAEGWVSRILFEAVGPMSMGAENFSTIFNNPVTDANDPVIVPAITAYQQITSQYLNSDFNPLPSWDIAAQKVLNNQAAMIAQGDWVKGYLTAEGLTPGVDFDVFAPPTPDAQSLYLVDADVMLIPQGAPHVADALDFLDTWSSVQGQVLFNYWKGSSPTRTDVDPSLLDPVAQEILSDLKNANYRIPPPTLVTNMDPDFYGVATGQLTVAQFMQDLVACSADASNCPCATPTSTSQCPP